MVKLLLLEKYKSLKLPVSHSDVLSQKSNYHFNAAVSLPRLFQWLTIHINKISCDAFIKTMANSWWGLVWSVTVASEAVELSIAVLSVIMRSAHRLKSRRMQAMILETNEWKWEQSRRQQNEEQRNKDSFEVWEAGKSRDCELDRYAHNDKSISFARYSCSFLMLWATKNGDLQHYIWGWVWKSKAWE